MGGYGLVAPPPCIRHWWVAPSLNVQDTVDHCFFSCVNVFRAHWLTKLSVVDEAVKRYTVSVARTNTWDTEAVRAWSLAEHWILGRWRQMSGRLTYSVGSEQHQKYDCSSTAAPSGAGECGILLKLAASCHGIEAGVFADRPAQGGALSSLLHDSHRRTTDSLRGLWRTCLTGARLSNSLVRYLLNSLNSQSTSSDCTENSPESASSCSKATASNAATRSSIQTELCYLPLCDQLTAAGTSGTCGLWAKKYRAGRVSDSIEYSALLHLRCVWNDFREKNAMQHYRLFFMYFLVVILCPVLVRWNPKTQKPKTFLNLFFLVSSAGFCRQGRRQFTYLDLFHRKWAVRVSAKNNYLSLACLVNNTIKSMFSILCTVSRHYCRRRCKFV